MKTNEKLVEIKFKQIHGGFCRVVVLAVMSFNFSKAKWEKRFLYIFCIPME